MDGKYGSIGYRIKRERIKQELKQSFLAKGICSPSYLSKVENETIKPNKEILNLLLKKLDLNLELINREEDIMLIQLFELYKNGIINRDREKITQEILKFQQPHFQFSSVNLYSYYLYIFRLKLMVRNFDKKLDQDISFLKKNKKNLTTKQTIIFNINMGLYFYLTGHNYKALSMFENVVKTNDFFSLEEWEKADFYNIISTSYLKNKDYNESIKYSLSALTYFKDNFLYRRIIDCFIIINIAYRNLCRFNEAKEYLSLAKKMAKDLNLTEFEGLLHHNFASLAAANGQPKLAINYYIQSFEYKRHNEQLINTLPTILCIIKEFVKLEFSSEIIKWCETGLSINKKSGLNSMSYFYHFNIYLLRYTVNTEKSTFEKTIKEAIKFFEKNNDSRYVQKYSLVLGDYYFLNKKYKLSSLYYQKATDVLLTQNLLRSVEDL